jgi:hypothetical protein
MREIRLYGSEGGGAVRSSYPYPRSRFRPRETIVCTSVAAPFAQGKSCCNHVLEKWKR